VAIAFAAQYTVDATPIALELTLTSDRWLISKPQLTIAEKGNPVISASYLESKLADLNIHYYNYYNKSL
jgi:hypothetical protein